MNRKARKRRRQRKRESKAVQTTTVQSRGATAPAKPGRLWTGIRWLFRGARGIVLLAIAALGLVSGGFALLPRVSTAPAESLNPKDPLAVMFQVSNDGYVRWPKLRMQCVPTQLEFALPNLKAYKPPGNGQIKITTYTAASLAPGEKAPVYCKTDFGGGLGQLQLGEIFINVCFRPYPGLPRAIVRSARFVAEHASDGSVRWFQRPLVGSDAWVNTNDGQHRDCVRAHSW